MAYWLVYQQFADRPELWPQNYICFTMILSIVVHVAQVLRHHCQSQLYTMQICNTLPVPSCSHVYNTIIKSLLNKQTKNLWMPTLFACMYVSFASIYLCAIYPKLCIVYSSVIAYTLINDWTIIHLHCV